MTQTWQGARRRFGLAARGLTAAALVAGGLVGTPARADSSSSLYVQPTLRARLGGAFPVGTTLTGQSAPDTGLTTGVELGGAIGWPGPGPVEPLFTRSPWLFPELGYSYRSADPSTPAVHLGSLGLGVGYGSLLFATVTYTPRLVVGAAGNQVAVGLRHGASLHLLGMLLSLELSHQLLRAGGALFHELQLTCGLNLGALKLALSPFR